MQVGIISDTHDNVPAIRAAMDVFEDRGVGVVVHCGDFVAPPAVRHLEREGISVHAVRGNNDGEREGLLNAFETMQGGELHGRFADLAFGGRTFAVVHGEEKPVVEALARSGEYDYVLHGHWHVRERRTVDGTTVVNPGGHFPTIPDEHRTVAIVDVGEDSAGQGDDTVEFVRVEDSV